VQTWPLDSRHEKLLRELARLITLAGAWRFARGPVVGATARDYPEPWDETRDGLAKVVARTLWHAHVDMKVVLEDVRSPAAPERRNLRQTKLELVRAEEGHIELAVSSIGNDHVAGIVAHEIGRACVAWLGRGELPFRATAVELPDAAVGSLATIVFGLGVVATNAAHHDRSAGETLGQMAYHEHQIAHAGGLDWQDLAFLLAVQATVRDDVLVALDTLQPSQAEHVAAWREVLDDHEDELVALLALGDVEAATPATRPPVPGVVELVTHYAEADLDRPNIGQRVFRYFSNTYGPLYGVIGLFAGLGVAIVSMLIFGTGVANLIPVGIITIGSFWSGRRKRLYKCATCRSFLLRTDTTCRGCGGQIAGDIDHPNNRLEAEEALEDAERAKRAS
jgi:hypothetical protein